MTVNPLADNEELSAVFFNALTNARAGELVVSGLAPSKGTGDWEVDLTSGVIQLGDSEVSVSADSLTHDAADASLNRVDIITADSAGGLSITKGTAAADPAAPDIPADEVLVAVVLFDSGASSLSAADVLDYRVFGDAKHILTATGWTEFKVNGGSRTATANVFEGDDVELQDVYPPLFGDGSDGSKNQSGGSLSGIKNYTTFTQSGTTNVSGFLIVYAQESITINGTLRARGASGGGGGRKGDSADGVTVNGVGGADGGPGLTAEGGEGSRRSNGSFSIDGGGPGAGGGGGAAYNTDNVPDDTSPRRGGDSGGRGNYDATLMSLASIFNGPLFQTFLLQTGAAVPVYGGGGGGGGGGGVTGCGTSTGAKGGDGGDGGDGGGCVVLIAPEITINGTLDASGYDGSNGQAATAGTCISGAGDPGDKDMSAAGGGGGGGGGGGFVGVYAGRLTESGASYDVSGGAGGTGGSSLSNSAGSDRDADDGYDGSSGTLVKVTGAV